MSVISEKISILTKGFDDVIDITSKIQDIVSSYDIKCGILNIFVASSTASLLTIENEPGIIFDISKLLELLVPINKIYQHDNVWHDGNANAHLKAAILGNHLTLPIFDGKVEINSCQQIVLIDFDNKSQTRQIIVSIDK